MFRKFFESIREQRLARLKRKIEMGCSEQLKILSRAVEQNPATIMITDKDGVIEYVNPKFTELTGYSLKEVVGNTPRVLKSGLTSPEEYTKLWRTILSGNKWQGEFCNRKKNGEFYWESASISPIMNERGQITHIVAVKEDVTSRKEAEAKFRAVVENAYDGVILAEADGRFTYVSPSVERILGYSPSSLIGRYPHEFLPAEDLPNILSTLDDLLTNPGKTVVADFRFRHQDGSWHWLENMVTNLLSDPNLRAIVVNYHDVTERKLAHAELAEETMRRRLLFEQSPDGIVIIEPQTGRFVEFNTAAHVQLGYSVEEFAKLSIGDIEAKETPEETRETIAGVIREGRADFETLHRTKDGELRYVHVTAQFLDIVGKQVYHCIWRDITARKQSQEALREKEFLLSQSQRLAHIGSWGWDLKSQIKWTDETFRIFGVSAEKFTPAVESFLELVHVDDRPAMIRWFDECRAGQSPDNLEFRTILPGGSVRYMSGTGDLMYDAEGRPFYMAGTVHDITERRLAEEAMAKSEEKFSKAFETSPEAILITSVEDGRYIEVNEAFLMKTGFRREDVIGHTSNDLRIWIDAGERAWFVEAISGNRPLRNVDMRFRMSDNEVRDFLVSTEILEIGGVKCCLSFTLDITERKKAEQELLKAKEAAEAATKAKSQFLAVMSHEIRTPMNGILAVTELLEMTQLSPQQKEYVETMQSSGKLLLAVINDILDLSKIEYGNLELQQRPVDVRECVGEVYDLLKTQTVRKGIRFSLRFDSNVPVAIISDKARLMQVLYNIAGNAVKFTDQGEVSISVAAGKQEEGSWILIFDIKDTGIGIAEDKMDSLFKPFTQIDSSTTREHSGTGLGLSIVSKIVEKMGGSISVTSEVGIGTEFMVKLVAAEVMEAVYSDAGSLPRGTTDREATSGERAGSLRILVAEDNATNRFVIHQALKNIGQQEDIVSNGLEAVEAETKSHYDVILMDLHMPKMDGFEATKRIKEMRRGREQPTIIALTADVPESIKQRCIDCGMSYFLTKPISISDLKSLLEQVEREKIREHEVKSGGLDETVASIKARLHVLGCDSDLNSCAQFLDAVRSDIQSNIDDAQTAFEANDIESLRLHIHSLKGAAANVGAAGLANVCRRIGLSPNESLIEGFRESAGGFGSSCRDTILALRRVKEEYLKDKRM